MCILHGADAEEGREKCRCEGNGGGESVGEERVAMRGRGDMFRVLNNVDVGLNAFFLALLGAWCLVLGKGLHCWDSSLSLVVFVFLLKV